MSDGWDEQRGMSQRERRRERRPPDLTLFGYPAVVLVCLDMPDGEKLEVKNPLTVGAGPTELDGDAIQSAIYGYLRNGR